ncbi:MAG: tetratricopeptide repeat protein [Pyrinomonadaceae bacterium]
MNHFKRKVNNLGLCGVAAFLVASSATFAAPQGEPKPTAPEARAKSAPDNTRTRRVGSAPVEKTAAEDPATKNDEVNQEAEPPQQSATPQGDAIKLLREQIGDAATAQEKLRLQFQLVEQLVANGAKQDAINELHAMTVEDRFDPQGFYNIGNALARIGDADGAAHAYRKAIDQRKGRYSRALNNLGVVLLRQGRWDEAYNAFTSALRIENFRYAEASYNLGRLYAARGENDLAIREWRRAVSVNPEHSAAAQALTRAGNEGRIEVVSLPRGPETSPAKQPAAESLATKPPKVVRRSTSHRALAVDPETYSFLQRARSAHERARYEEAVANYRRVISRMGGYFPPANLEMGYALVNLKQADEALASLLPVAQNDGARYPISYYHIARLHEAQGNLKLAEESFGLAAALYKQDNAQFLLDVSRVREKLGDYQGALTALEEYLAILERKHQKPEWSAGRLASLRERVASQPKP